MIPRTNAVNVIRKIFSAKLIMGLLLLPQLIGGFGTAEEALGQALSEYASSAEPSQDFQITQFHEWEGWAYAIAEPFDKATGARVESETFVPLLATRDEQGNWAGVSPRSISPGEFNSVIGSFPNELLDENTKALLAQQDEAQTELSAQAFSGHKLPWTYTNYSQLYAKGNCYDSGSGISCNNTGHDNQLDFSVEGSSISGDIIASKPGTVVFVKESSNTGACSINSWTYANMAVIQHATGEYSWYVHLAYNSIPDSIQVGTTVGYGTKIGVEGNTGFSCGNHLHFMTSSDHGAWTDPAKPDQAPWPPTRIAVDFVESTWANLTIGNWYQSQNASPDVLPPQPPTLTLPTNGQVFNEGDAIPLSWTGPGDAFYGEIWGGPGALLYFDWQAQTTKNIGPQWAGYGYSWHVKARNANGEGGWSQTQNFTVRPAAPQNVSATPASCSSINLAWNDISGNEEGYKVYRDGILAGTTGGGIKAYQDTNLATNTDYSYVVKAYRGSIESLPGNTVVQNTGTCPPNVPAPSAPVSGTVIGRYESPVLKWDPANGATEYYAELWSGSNVSASGWTSQTQFLVGDNFGGGEYSWHVKARNAAGESGWSPAWTVFRKFAAPGSLLITGRELTSITLSWNPSVDAPGKIQGYRIYRNENDIAVTDANTTTYTNSGLTCESAYRYTVRAFGGSLESDPSNQVNTSTLYCPPGPFGKTGPMDKAIEQPISGLSLEWSPSTPTDGYQFCIDRIDNSACDSTWSTLTTKTSALLGTLPQGVAYYWQVRSRTAGGVVQADGGTWWSFTTNILPPTNDDIEARRAITVLPSSIALDTRAATIQPGDPALEACNRLPGLGSTWYLYTPTRAGDLSVDTRGSDYDTMVAVWSGTPGSLLPVGCNDDIGLATAGWDADSSLKVELQAGQNYYIETASYAGKITSSIIPEGEIKGNPVTGGMLKLHVSFAPYPLPGAFNKATPANLALSQPVNPLLKWGVSAGAVNYEYCLDKTNNKLCDSSWTPVDTNSAQVTGLELDTTYYWQVRANNKAGNTYANSGAWWYFRAQPPATAQVAPSEASVPSSRRPAFSWAMISTASTYTLQVSKYPTLAYPLINVTIPTTTYAPSADLPAGTLLYWRVRVNNANGSSAWSAIWSFTTPIPPSIPVLISPAINALLTVNTPRLDWGNSGITIGAPGYHHYRLQVASDAKFESILLDQDTGTLPEQSEFTLITPLAADSRFWWRVQAFNTAGQYSSWSAPLYFRTAILPTTLLTPTPEEHIMSKRPSFSWATVTGAKSYPLQVSRYGNFSTLAVNLTLTGTQYIPSSDLAAGVTYYVRVRVNGLMGPSAWTETRAIFIPRTPSVPALVAPTTNVLLTSYTPVLDWANSTIPLGAPSFSHYHIQLARDSAFTNLVIDQAMGSTPEESAFALTAPLTPDSKYWWRVRAFNSLGEYSSWSAVRYFKTAISPTSLVSPEQGDFPLSLRPAFNWQTIPGAVSYTLQISRYANLSYPIVNSSITTASYTPGFNLPAGKVIYWRVRVNGAMGPSLWTETRSFTAPMPPSIPVLVSPAANALLTSYATIRLDWGNSAITTGAPAFDHYWLQVARDDGFTDLLVNQAVGGLPSESEFTVTSGLLANSKYWWRVKAFNASQQGSEWSAVRYFRTSALPPVLVSPITGQSVTALRPLFSWEAVTGASSYSIQVSRYSTFSTLLINTTSSGLGYTPTINLPRRVTLYWRLRANGPNGPSLWSSTSFVIQ